MAALSCCYLDRNDLDFRTFRPRSRGERAASLIGDPDGQRDPLDVVEGRILDALSVLTTRRANDHHEPPGLALLHV